MAEAMMWGLPMVVSEWRGNRDVTGEAAEYFDVTLSMESSLSAKLQQVLADRRTLETRAIKSRKRFVSAFRRQESEYRGLVARLVGAKSKA
jgi:glycosyltransferase involved in cell wall biosynthesis